MWGSQRAGIDPGGGRWWQRGDRAAKTVNNPPSQLSRQTFIFSDDFWSVEVARAGSTIAVAESIELERV